MSKKNKKLEDGWSTAIKAFGAVAAVAMVGQKIVSTVRDGSMVPPEYASQYSLVKNLATAPTSDTSSLSNGRNETDKPSAQYTLSELERFKDLYKEEMASLFEKRADYQRHRWLLDTLQLLDATIALMNRIQSGDFSGIDTLQGHYQQLDQRLQGEEKSIGLFERMKARVVGLGATRSHDRAEGEGRQRKLTSRQTSSRRKRHYEESADPPNPSDREDRKRTLRPRSAKTTRTKQRALPIVRQLISPSPASLEDAEDQSVITTASFRSRPPTTPAKSPSSSASKSKRVKESPSRSAAIPHSKQRLSPADLVGLPVIFTDGNEGTIIEAFSENIVHSQKDLDEIRFKIELDGETVVKSHGEFKDDIAWPIRDISDHA
ncbi:MAG: hypothetical protein SGILL_008774, partial [Bacillariaceae sp.]